jgi:hypothetical protein
MVYNAEHNNFWPTKVQMLFLKGEQYKNTELRSLQNETQNEKQGIYIQTMPLADLNHSHRFTYLNASKAQKSK